MKKTRLIIFSMLTLLITVSAQEQAYKEQRITYATSLNLHLYKPYSYAPYDFVSPTLSFEYHNSISDNSKFSLALHYGRDFFVEPPYRSIYGTEFGFTFGNKYAFEIGGGLHYWLMGTRFFAKIGGRFDVGKGFFVRAAYTPFIRTAFPYRIIIGESGNSFILSLGYHLNKKSSSQIQGFIAKIRDEASLQISTQPFFKDIFSYQDEIQQYNLKEIAFEIRLFKLKSFRITATAGYGTTKRHHFLPIGVHLLYGKKIHHLELGVYSLNGEDYMRVIQAELAYRLHLGKRFLLKTGYTPYWWSFPKWNKMFNKPNEAHFVHSIKFGVGYRFH